MATEEMACAARLARLRWGETWCCPRCGDANWCHLESRPRVFQCSTCGKHLSVTAGTILHRTKLPLSKWFLALELFCAPGSASVRELSDELELPVKTAFAVLHRIRKAIDAEGPPLDGAAGVWRGWIKCSRQPRVQWRLPALAAADQDHQLFLHAAPGGHEDALREHSPDAIIQREGAGGLLKAAIQGAVFVLSRLRYTHRQVSQRYLHRYLRSLVYLWHIRTLPLADAVEGLARRCIVSPAMTFALIRPPPPG